MTSLSHPSPTQFHRSSTRSTRAGRCRRRGTPTPASRRSSGSASSPAPGSTAARRSRSPRPARSWRRRPGTSRSSSRATARATLRGFVNVCRHRAYTIATRLRLPRDAAVPVPRVDLRARRLAPQGAALGARGGLRPRRLLAAARLGRHLGTVPLRQSRPRRGSARRDARRAAGDRRAAAVSTSRRSRSTRTTSGRSRRTGRSRSRTTSSATTARPPIPASAR